jgi:aspartate carbamoyltransferase regulatory subunit
MILAGGVRMLGSKELDKMSQMAISEIDPNTLVNVSAVSVDTALPQAERVQQFLRQIHNPYCFMSGDTPVRIRFAGADKELSQSLIDYFSRLKQK